MFHTGPKTPISVRASDTRSVIGLVEFLKYTKTDPVTGNYGFPNRATLGDVAENQGGLNRSVQHHLI